MQHILRLGGEEGDQIKPLPLPVTLVPRGAVESKAPLCGLHKQFIFFLLSSLISSAMRSFSAVDALEEKKRTHCHAHTRLPMCGEKKYKNTFVVIPAVVREVQVDQESPQQRPEPVRLRAPDVAFHDGERLSQAGPQGRELSFGPDPIFEEGMGGALSGLRRVWQETVSKHEIKKKNTATAQANFVCSRSFT